MNLFKNPTRRQWLQCVTAAGCGASLLRGGALFGASAGSLRSIEPLGRLISDCTLPGETRKDDVVPAHPNGIPVSKDRWLLVYATRGFRGVDDDRSIVYQLRRSVPVGPIIKEGFLSRSFDGWDPMQEGKSYFKQHGHPVVFGVPKGAKINGQPVPHANIFVAKWRIVGRMLNEEKDRLEHANSQEGRRDTQGVEWLQFRLNAAEDDIEIIQPAGALRQKGFETGPAFCSAASISKMNQSFTPPVPFSRDGSAWVDCNHFDQSKIAVLKYVYNPQRGLYEWTETGPVLGEAKRGVFEASLARAGDHWLISARRSTGGGTAWCRTDDPFGNRLQLMYGTAPAGSAPRTLFTCADGVPRLFTGDTSLSMTHNARDPLYCWNVDAEQGFALTNSRVIFDSKKAGLPIRPAAVPKIDMCKLLPTQGRTQLAVFRVSVRSYNHPYVGGNGKATGIPAINAEEKACCGIYYARLTYDNVASPLWEL